MVEEAAVRDQQDAYFVESVRAMEAARAEADASECGYAD